MNYLDIMFILIAGVFIAIGIFKGFVKTIIDFLSGIISFFAALILARPIAGVLAELTYFDPARQNITDFFNNRAQGASETVSSAVGTLSVPEFISEYILKGLPDPSSLMSDGVQYVSAGFFTLMLTAIVFVVILIIVRMIFFFLSKSIASLFKKVKILQSTDRFLGGLLGAVNALFISFIILAVIAMMASKFPHLVGSISDLSLIHI